MTARTDVEDDLAAIHSGLERDGYYVHPSLAGQFEPDDLAAIAAGRQQTPEATYVVAWPLRPNDVYGGNGLDLLTRLHAEHPDPGVYLVSTGEDFYDYARIDGRQWDVVGESDGPVQPYEVLSVLTYEEPPTLGAAFARAVELLGLPSEELQEAHAEAREEGLGSSSTGQPSGPDGSVDGDGDGDTLVALGLGAVLALAVVGVVLLRRRRRRREPAEPFVLPAAAVSRIRAARDREVRDDARNAVAALGRAVDATDLDEQRSPVAWQHALDHLAAARRVLERDDPELDLLDAVGALVLARRGEEALRAAHAGRSWTPSPGCYLHPLHRGATEPHRLPGGEQDVTAPLCEECRDALDDGREPDLLEVEHDGRPRPYYETGAEPWATTGFGSLDVDLVRALHGGRR